MYSSNEGSQYISNDIVRADDDIQKIVGFLKEPRRSRSRPSLGQSVEAKWISDTGAFNKSLRQD